MIRASLFIIAPPRLRCSTDPYFALLRKLGSAPFILLTIINVVKKLERAGAGPTRSRISSTLSNYLLLFLAGFLAAVPLLEFFAVELDFLLFFLLPVLLDIVEPPAGAAFLFEAVLAAGFFAGAFLF
jgi:uncharacterized membrane protein